MKKLDARGSVANFVGAAALFFGVLFWLVLGGAQDALLATSGGSHFAAAKAAAAKEAPRWKEAYGKLPLSFEENRGQTAEEVRYLAHGTGYELFLTSHEAVLALRSRRHHDLSPLHRTASLRAMRKARKAGQLTALRIQFEGANLHSAVNGMGRLPSRTNYFLGNDPKKWHTDVPSYGRVKYEGVYPGVDLVFYGNQHKLEYDFLVAPGADPEAIQLKIAGARKMRFTSSGNVLLSVAAGEVELQKPLIYQMIGDERRLIKGRYVVAADHRVRFSVAHYDRSKPLVLDPVLNYSTYLGGSDEDTGFAIAVDGAGNAFVAGQTMSTDFPAGANGAVATPPANSGASFVAELDPTGANLLYATYLAGSTIGPIMNRFGPSEGEGAFSIAVDSSGKVYVTGVTFATDFPTTSANALNPGPLASNDNGTVYLTKFDPTVSGPSSLIYSTYIAGTGGDFANSVAADDVGNAYVVGLTDSADFPTRNPFQSALSNPSGNAFLTRIDTTKSQDASLIFSTYLGGNGANAATFLAYGDQGFGVAADSSGNAYVVGTTSSTDSSFITGATAYQSAPPAPNTYASVFVSRIDTTQVGPASLVYSTYLAGSTEDQGFAIALRPNNVAYVTGTTISTDYPFPGATTGAFDTTSIGFGKAFITLVDTNKSGLSSVPYSTYLGGTGGCGMPPCDVGLGIKVDASGNAYVVGTTQSADFAGAGTLNTLGAFQPNLLNAFGDAFVAKLNPAGSGQGDLLYATYFGGGDGVSADQGFGIAIDSATPPNAYITGETASTDLPVSAGAFQTQLNQTGSTGFTDAYVTKLTLIPTVAVVPASLDFGVQPVGATSVPQTVTLTNNNNVTLNFFSIAITGTNSADFAVATDTCTPSLAPGAQCTVSVTLIPSVAAGEAAILEFDDDDLNSPQYASLSGTGSNSAPGVGLAPTSLGFGNQPLSATSAAMTVTVTNTGTAALTINSFAASGDFAATSTGASACPRSPATLAAGANCAINVTFTPTASGARTGMLSVTDNAGGNPHKVPLSGAGTGPGAGLAPTSLSFGNQLLATTSAPMTVTLTNIGIDPLTIGSFAASGDFAATSTGASACPTSPATLATGANCTINVTFTPTASGARTGTLSLADNAGGSPHTVPLGGAGTAPGVGLAPTSLSFGNQLLATTGAPMTVTLTNTGTAALTINSFAASGDFAATSTGANACPTSPATLAAGANCTINVTFTPTASGARTGTLSVADNADGSPQTLPLSGTGTAPGAGLAPTSLSFGNQLLATTGAPMTVTLTNTGTAPLTITSFAASGDFAATSAGASACPTSSATLAAGANCTINVTFTPTASGPRTGTLSVTDNAGGSPQIITLSGNATAPGVGLAPTSLGFGNQLLATTSTPMTVTLTNTGTAALTITSFAASGDFAATSIGASACPTSPATLAAGANCTINVTFTPTASSARTGTLSVTDNADGSPQIISLNGNATAPGVGLAPTSLGFGNQLLATTSTPMAVTLTNTGAAALTITSFAASGDFAAMSTGAGACPTSPATLAAGGNCTINVTFTPTASGARTGTLSVTDNAGGSPQIMTLSGSGTAPGVGLAPTSLGFGNQPLATTSTPMTVTLTNTGTAALTINSFAASGDFAATSAGASACPTSPATLAADGNCTINVTFTPTALGARTGTLSVADNSGGSLQTVPLSGNGTAAPDFGLTGPAGTQNVKAGSTLTFTVTMMPIGGFKAPVGLACAGALMGATCTVSPASVTATDGVTAQQAQVSMSTNAFVIPPTRLPVPAPPAWRWIPLFLALLLLALVPKMRRLRVRLGMATALILLAFLAGCAGSPGAPKGPVPVALTITGTSGTSTHAVQVNVMVQ